MRQNSVFFVGVCFCIYWTLNKISQSVLMEARWPSGRASDSGARGLGFDPHSGRRVVSLSKIHLPPTKVLVIPRKQWLPPDITKNC